MSRPRDLAETIADIESAAERLEGIAVSTPLIRSSVLDQLAGGRDFMKPETFQVTGSFKIRGAYNLMSRLTPAQRRKGVVAWSSGNHAQGVAAAGSMLGITTRIVMPQDAPAAKIEVDKSDAALRLLDAEGKAYAQFPITSGTAKFPLPIGDWTIESINPDPWYNYDPKLIVNARRGDRKARLPPGPNGPVGTMWMALSKPHYGIHGTPEPGLIGRTQSSGCVRLTNWSAHAVAGAASVGMTVSMVE